MRPKIQTYTQTPAGNDFGPTDHLERALESTETDVKNFHIRQALQLLIARSESG